jgi:glutamine amidotransferase
VIALIDYRAGNLTSVRKALTHLGASYVTPTSPDELDACVGIIVPGVGNFRATEALGGEWTTAVRRALDRTVPLLGICLGLQWLFDGSDEAPGLAGLGAMTGTCTLITNPTPDEANGASGRFKVPHVGWNSLHVRRRSWLLEGIREGDQVYFTHSFAAPVTSDCVASTRYGVEFASVVERDHVAGVQFHPEKSGDVGLTILRNFLGRIGASTPLS